MNKYAHLVGGFTFGLLFSNIVLEKVATMTGSEMPIIAVTAIVVVSSIGACLIPDIDHRSSSISKKHPIISKVVRVFAGHRELTHAPLLYIILGSLLLGLTSQVPLALHEIYTYVVIGCFIGILSHLTLDAMTKSGIHILYPFSKMRFNILRLQTGKFICDGLAMIVMLLVSFFSIMSIPI